MVARGIRKRFNNDLEAQLASIAQADWQREAELDKQRLRFSVAWYHVGSGLWLEVESPRGFGGKLTVTSYPEKPERFIDTPWGIKSKEAGDFYRTEAGFIADGLPHAVWVGGGRFIFNRRERSSRFLFDHEKSKSRLHQQLIVNINKLPQIFYDLYGIKVSIPMIQQAFKEYQDGTG